MIQLFDLHLFEQYTGWNGWNPSKSGCDNYKIWQSDVLGQAVNLAGLLEPQPMRGLGSSCQTIWSPCAVSMGSLWVIGWLLIDVAG